MDDYLSKPVAREQLDACLQRWLPRQPALPGPTSGGAANVDTESASNAAQARALPILDNSVIDELYEVAGADTITILQLFLEDAPGIIEQLETAAANRDSMQLRDLAHTLKSSSANVGAQAVSMQHAASNWPHAPAPSNALGHGGAGHRRIRPRPPGTARPGRTPASKDPRSQLNDQEPRPSHTS